MKYTFTDWDKRAYVREVSETIVIESKETKGDFIELAIGSERGAFISLTLTEQEADAICSALIAGKSRCMSKITVK